MTIFRIRRYNAFIWLEHRTTSVPKCSDQFPALGSVNLFFLSEIRESKYIHFQTFGREVDWWSVGILLYELIFEDPPFYCDSVVDTYNKIMNHETELCFPEDHRGHHPVTEDIIRSFLSEKSMRLGRQGTDEIKAHPFFENCNWTFDNIRNCMPIMNKL